MNPRNPVFIPSKGRHEQPMTARALERMGVPFRVVVEPQEADAYRKAVGKDRVVVLPFANLGLGSIPARNFIWDLADDEGTPWHWIIDDNVSAFYRMALNRRIRVDSGTIFYCCEDFVERYENVGMAGLNNVCWVPDRRPNIPPFILNTRIYSMTMIRTDIVDPATGSQMRWRGRHNEDTDISLRILKAGLCTVQFNAFLGGKAATLTMKGGNTDTVYAGGDHRREFAMSLRRQHPEVVRLVWKYDRWHHQVYYHQFKNNKLKLRPGVTPTAGANEYGMRLRRLDEQVECPPMAQVMVACAEEKKTDARD